MNRRCLGMFASLVIFAGMSGLAYGEHLQSAESGGIAYHLLNSPASIQRYDMSAGVWLSAITLPEAPTSFAVDASGVYVAFSRRVSRFNLNGTGETPLFNTATEISQVLADASRLFVFEWNGYTSCIDKTAGTLLSQQNFWYTMTGASIAPTTRKLFARSTGVSPSDIVQIPYSSAGILGSQTDSPYHGSFPDATRTFVFPNEARVADDGGVVYSTSDLSYNNSLAGGFLDLAFYGDLPIVLRGGALISYSNTFLETGRYVVGQPITRILVRGETIYGFYESPLGTMNVTQVPVSLLTTSQPGQPVDPHGLAYEPDKVEVDSNGIVYLLSRANLSIFRWSMSTQDYLPTVPLAEVPSYMALSDVGHRIYLAYPSGAIHKIDLGGATLLETPFANLPQTPLGLSTAGEYAFACDPSGAWATHYTFAPSGAQISAVEWNYYSREYVWSAANHKMYFYRDDTSPNDIIWEDVSPAGVIGGYFDSPYHGEVQTYLPIRVAPDGSVVLLGSGQIYDGHTLVNTANLSNNITDAVWHQGFLFTTLPSTAVTTVQRWRPTFALDGTFQETGAPLRILAVPPSLLIITSVNGVPTFNAHDTGAPDADGDHVADYFDNCPAASNTDQADRDGDGTGDACNDAQDADGDEWADGFDNCPAIANPDQANADGDALGDDCDPFPKFYLRVRASAPAVGLPGSAISVTYRLEDGQGNLVTALQGVRVTLTLDGSATFGAATQGVILQGGGTGRALAEFAQGLVVVSVSDTVGETVLASAEDTEAAGIAILHSISEDFERGDGGFTHAGAQDPWQYGTPTMGPSAPHSGTKLWATNLSGTYQNYTDASLTSVEYPFPNGQGANLTFWHWLSEETCCDLGRIEVSTNGGSTWQVIDSFRSNTSGWVQRSYPLSSYGGGTIRFRFHFTSDSSYVSSGWYIDDFAVEGFEARIRFLDEAGDDDGDGLTNGQEILAGTNPLNPDTDGDTKLDGIDNCPLTPNTSQADSVHPNGIGDACDDPDHDGVVDATDNCPDTANADQADHVHPNTVGDACEDPDNDGVFDLTDNCPHSPNPSQADDDADGIGSACDICPALYNPAQSQTAACLQVTEGGAHCLGAQLELVIPASSGEIDLYDSAGTAPSSLTFDILGTSCSAADTLSVSLNGTPIGSAQIDPQYHCGCMSPLQQLLVTNAELLRSLWLVGQTNHFLFTKPGGGSLLAWIRLRVASASVEHSYCLYDYGSGSCDRLDICAAGYFVGAFGLDAPFFDPGSLGTPIVAAPFQNGVFPSYLGLDALPQGTASLCVQRTGGSPATDCLQFQHQGEHVLVFNGAACGPPVAQAGADLRIECASAGNGPVTLDGTHSTDPKSSPATNDGIVRYEWFEAYGTAAERPLGEGPYLTLSLPLGVHTITLRVTDRFGATATDDTAVMVADTVAPQLVVSVSPSVLKPGNHQMVQVTATVSSGDVCGSTRVILDSVTSSEPDDAPGGHDGHTAHDIQEAEIGTDDRNFSLRAEYDRRGTGRVYTIRYRAIDTAGNAATGVATVTAGATVSPPSGGGRAVGSQQ